MQSIKQRATLLSTAALFMASVLTACGGTSTSSTPSPVAATPASTAAAATTPAPAAKGQVSFAFWGADTEAAALKGAVDGFQKANPNIKVDAQWIQKDYTTKLQTMIAGGTAPDVILVSAGDINDFANAFAPAKLDASKFSSPKLVDAMTVNGKAMATPFIIKPKVMAINVSLFKQNNITLPSKTEPMSPQQFQDISAKLTKGSGATKVYGSEPLWMGNWIYALGGTYYKENLTKSALGDKGAIDAANFIINTKKSGFVPNDTEKQGQSMMNWFLSGRIGMFTDFGPWYLPQMADVKGMEWDLVPFPGNGGSKEVDGLAISKDSKNKEAAQVFVDYMTTSTEGQSIIGGNKSAYGIPVIASAGAAFEAIYPDKNMKAWIYAAINQTNQESPKHGNQINDAMKPIDDQTGVGIGKEDPSKIFPEVAKKIDDILKN